MTMGVMGVLLLIVFLKGKFLRTKYFPNRKSIFTSYFVNRVARFLFVLI